MGHGGRVLIRYPPRPLVKTSSRGGGGNGLTCSVTLHLAGSPLCVALGACLPAAGGCLEAFVHGGNGGLRERNLVLCVLDVRLLPPTCRDRVQK